MCICVFHRSVLLALAAGVTWTSRTLAAPWAARQMHTSVIDAAGAIYVIGGRGAGTTTCCTYYNDVWASTDGARPDYGWSAGYLPRFTAWGLGVRV